MIIEDRNHLPQELADMPEEDFVLAIQEEIHDEKFQTKPVGFYRDALIRLAKSKLSMLSLFIILAIVVMAFAVPRVTGYTYKEQNVKQANLPPKIPGLEGISMFSGTMIKSNVDKRALENTKFFPEGCVIEIVREYEVKNRSGQMVPTVDVKIDAYKYNKVPEGEYHWFGTDELGRDIMTRLFQGTRVSLLIAFISVITNVVIGVIYGSIAGYYGGKVDMVLTHFAEVLDGMPYIVVTILFMLLFGSGMFSIILALTVTGWIGTARLIRAQFYRFKGREYVLAARTLGVSDRKLIFRHILPNTVGPLITRAMISIPGAIFSESFLAYIGLGIKMPEPSIGVLLSEGQKVLLLYPTQTLFPAVVISLLMVAFNLFANGLRDALDPTRRGEEV